MSFVTNLVKTSALVAVSAGIGSAVTDPDTWWYKTLKKPSFQPPTAAFPIAWTALYAAIAVASAKAITTGEKDASFATEGVDLDLTEVEFASTDRQAKKALKKAVAAADKEWEAAKKGTDEAKKVRAFKRALILNLILNTGWSALFWQGRDLKIASIEAGLLALSSADLARRAFSLDKGAGALLLPYVGWTSFATVLTAAIENKN